MPDFSFKFDLPVDIDNKLMRSFLEKEIILFFSFIVLAPNSHYLSKTIEAYKTYSKKESIKRFLIDLTSFIQPFEPQNNAEIPLRISKPQEVIVSPFIKEISNGYRINRYYEHVDLKKQKKSLSKNEHLKTIKELEWDAFSLYLVYLPAAQWQPALMQVFMDHPAYLELYNGLEEIKKTIEVLVNDVGLVNTTKIPRCNAKKNYFEINVSGQNLRGKEENTDTFIYTLKNMYENKQVKKLIRTSEYSMLNPTFIIRSVIAVGFCAYVYLRINPLMSFAKALIEEISPNLIPSVNKALGLVKSSFFSSSMGNKLSANSKIYIGLSKLNLIIKQNLEKIPSELSFTHFVSLVSAVFLSIFSEFDGEKVTYNWDKKVGFSKQ